jgi:hypothetical protein
MVLENPSDFINEPWFDEILAHLCPNKCNGEGTCVLGIFKKNKLYFDNR